MNGYERIMNAIAGKTVDRTPVWPFVMRFSAKYSNVPYSNFCQDYRELMKAQIETSEDFELDAVTIDSDPYREASACGAILEFPENDLPIMKKYAVENKKKFAFKVPDISTSKRLVDKIEGIRAAKNYFKNEKAVSGWIEAPLQSAGALYDLNEFMIDFYEDTGFIQEILEFSTELGVKFALEQAKAGADVIGIGDAIASMVSPDFYEKFIFPYTKKLVDEIKKHSDVKLKYHICGDAWHVLQCAGKIQFDIINIDSLVDMRKAFDLVGDSVCIKGNIDPVGVLKNGTEEQIDQKAKELIGLKQPRFILSAGCEITPDTPHANLHMLAKAAKNS